VKELPLYTHSAAKNTGKVYCVCGHFIFYDRLWKDRGCGKCHAVVPQAYRRQRVGEMVKETSPKLNPHQDNVNEKGSDTMPSVSASSSSAGRPDARLERVERSEEKTDEHNKPSAHADQYEDGTLPGTAPKAAARKRKSPAPPSRLEESIDQEVRAEGGAQAPQRKVDGDPCAREFWSAFETLPADVHNSALNALDVEHQKSPQFPKFPSPVSTLCGGEPKQGVRKQLVAPAEAVPGPASDDEYQEEEFDCEPADMLGDVARDVDTEWGPPPHRVMRCWRKFAREAESESSPPSPQGTRPHRKSPRHCRG